MQEKKQVISIVDKFEERLFATVPLKILDSTELTGNEKLLLIRIVGLAKKEGYCFASNSYLANIMNTSESTIKRMLKKLRYYKYIKCYYRNISYKSIRYIYINEEKCLISPKFYDNQSSNMNLTQSTNELHNIESINKDNNINGSQNTLRPALIYDEKNKQQQKPYIDSSLAEINHYYQQAVNAIYNANNEPIPKKCAELSLAYIEWQELIPNPELTSRVISHLKTVWLDAVRAERWKEWKNWKLLIIDSGLFGSEEYLERHMSTSIFVPKLKSLHRYIQQQDWENVYLKIRKPFWGGKPLGYLEKIQDWLKIACIDIELIENLDYELIKYDDYMESIK